MGEPLGIRFEAIESIMNLYSIFDPEERMDLFDRIQLIDNIRMSYRKDELIRQQQQKKTAPRR